MPIYEYMDVNTGEIIELFKPVSKCDSIGSEIHHDGRTLRRLVGDSQISAGVETVVQKYPYTSLQHCRRMEGAGAYTKDGKPIITSRRNEREFMAMHNLERD